MNGVNLALGGGAARGLAHIGILHTFESEGVPITGIAGCSIGALVAAAYGAGKLHALEEAALKIRLLDLIKFADFAFLSGGLIKGDWLVQELRRLIGDVHFEDLRLPTAVVATDLITGDTVVFQQGPVIDAVRASISVPGLFTPVPLDSRLLVNGGVSDRVPADVARSLSPARTVAVDVGSQRDKWTATATFARIRWSRLRSFLQEVRDSVNHSPIARAMEVAGLLNEEIPSPVEKGSRLGLLQTLLASVDALEAQLAAQNHPSSTADWVIHPDIDHIDAHRFDLAREAIDAGQRAAEEFLKGKVYLPGLGRLTHSSWAQANHKLT
ncbi:patatin-like phospholipase family protein [Kyrpidia tusciae]|uniref:patatin-like phospholipase family protein n=1 Tax=Kyrpidia tusciae TaxID=33943 RepID=UPI00145DA2F9|nr:patatin-like phospholipase family protein [Kyrpidia tusciae]